MEEQHEAGASTASSGFSFGGWKGQRLATAATPFAQSASQQHRKQVTSLPSHPPLEEAVEERTPEEVSGPQLRSEGSELAEAGRYREALAKWEHALLLTPDDPLLFELKAQVLMEEERWWAAVLAATRATELDPRWADGFVTRGRAELNYGEVALAIASFETALDLLPPDHGYVTPVERERAAPPIDYDALKYRKRRAIISEQNQREQPPGGEQPTTTTREKSERGADDDGGQDPRTLWETVRQVGEASLRERRGRTDQQDGTTNDFIEEFDEAEGGDEEEQMDIEGEKKGSNHQ
ncbi:tetratricopeptide repeat domain containing protein [Acanthamoeba castellanii str. Neff]|uniref:Tetratricopeptide repeat domain containing protein n=1 Tax=Acanthamoeba castellanii (strain ATCC 30010 / Neff) TaxID=1257118 RepID=L8GYY8_ACACF|nr:tetratricopeptide repeat domain containing protein [Acanthamoeba castellanii str. Neff]ELR17326.1 tetratricopeptide repeat domain containing protein [Acanthamoeba castellanii str. Neff]